MPTLELISIDCPEIPVLPAYPTFAYRMEKELRSHRSLFQPAFDELSGVIVHLANKELEGTNSRWFAGMLMDWYSTNALVFQTEVRDDVADLMQRLLDASPVGQVTFSSDYQFGGCGQETREVSLRDFFRLHDRHALRYNTLYQVHEELVPADIFAGSAGQIPCPS